MAIDRSAVAGKFLEGRTALVTGASRGTGVQIALHLARVGARVAVHYRSSRSAAERVVKTIRAGGGEAEAIAADVARPGDLRQLVGEVRARLGPVSVLVNNAGPFNDTPFHALAEADWDYIMNANLKAAFFTAQLVVDDMRRLRWGRIINIGATSAFVRSHSVYGLAKAALLHLTESLALELAPAITVNAVVPSQIASPRAGATADYETRAIEATPLGRLVSREEIARVVVLLCSEPFDFMTGRAIILDGGRSIPRFPRLDLAME